jgi:hypothetical protein
LRTLLFLGAFAYDGASGTTHKVNATAITIAIVFLMSNPLVKRHAQTEPYDTNILFYRKPKRHTEIAATISIIQNDRLVADGFQEDKDEGINSVAACYW